MQAPTTVMHPTVVPQQHYFPNYTPFVYGMSMPFMPITNGMAVPQPMVFPAPTIDPNMAFPMPIQIIPMEYVGPQLFSPPVISNSKVQFNASESAPSNFSSESCGSASLLPPVDTADRSRSPSYEREEAFDASALVLGNEGDFSNTSSECDSEQQRGHKQMLITSVREELGQLLERHFPYKKNGSIMSVYGRQYIADLDELKDVLRGKDVGNIRAKSVRSLKALVGFLQAILNCRQVNVFRVDVILQRKKSGHLKGLLVNIQFSSQQEFLFVRDHIYNAQGFQEALPKFMPAIFAQDRSWKGRAPRDLRVAQVSGDIRVQGPLPRDLADLGLEPQCRVKSISVIYKTGSKKAKTFELNKDQFLRVLTDGVFTVKGTERKLNDKTRLTVSFEEDWKTDFWRAPASSFPVAYQ